MVRLLHAFPAQAVTVTAWKPAAVNTGLNVSPVPDAGVPPAAVHEKLVATVPVSPMNTRHTEATFLSTLVQVTFRMTGGVGGGVGV